MKRTIRLYSMILAELVLILTVLTPVQISAASRIYLIKIYAGNVGTFSDKCKEYYSRLDGAEAVISDSCIELELEQGMKLPKLPVNSDGFITYSSDHKGQYYVLEDVNSGAAAFHKNQETVSRSEDVTIQYGRLLDGVEYTVKFVEQGTGTEIAIPKTVYEEAGREITETAPVIIGFTLVSESTKTMKLVKNGTNIITFEYSRNATGTTYTETTSTEVIDGGTTTEYVETEVPTYVVTATAGGGGAGAVGGGGGAPGAAAGAPDAGAADGGVVIPDAEVPLAAGPGSENQTNTPEGSDETADEYQIDENDVPLSETPEKETELWVWIVGVIGALLLAGGGTFLIIQNKLKNVVTKK